MNAAGRTCGSLLLLGMTFALVVPAAAQTLKGPISELGWLVGTWNCTGTVSVDGKHPHVIPKSTFIFTPASGGSALTDKEDSGPVRSTGHLYFTGRQWIDDVVAHSSRGTSNYSFAGEDVDVAADHVDLKGTGSVRGTAVGIRLVRRRTGSDAFHEASYLSAGGDWHQIEDVSCKRR